MSGLPFFSQVLTSQKAAGSAKASFTTAASAINATEIIPIPANYLTVGTKLRIRVMAALSNVVTATPTFTFQVMMGSVIAWTSGPITTNTSANSGLPLTLDIELRVDSIGSGTTAKFMGVGKLMCAAFASGSTAINVPTSTPAVGTGFDSTVANNLDFYVACSASNASNAITIQDYTVEQLN